MTGRTADDFQEVERSTLDREEVRTSLEGWVASQLPGARVSIPSVGAPSGSGMSSETLLFEAEIEQDGEREVLPLVGRLAPRDEDVPTFPSYDLASQFRLLQLVGAESDVPVPGARWLEPDPALLGAPFLVMDRVDGRVPPDVPPYLFAGWLFDATPTERQELQHSTIEAIAGLHGIDPVKSGADFLAFPVAGDTSLRRHFQNQRDYYAWLVEDGVRHPLTERTFGWLEDHWPSDEGREVISWGDSRIGNVIYDGFRPKALLDWEMAGLGPRELDIGWLCFMHSFFQEIADMAGQPGLPDLLRLADVAGDYERISGTTLRDLDWYFTYAGLRHAIIMARIHRRMVHFGQAEWAEDPDTVIPHKPILERILDEGWSPLG